MKRSDLVVLASALLDHSRDPQALLPLYDHALSDEGNTALIRFIACFAGQIESQPAELQAAVAAFLIRMVVPSYTPGSAPRAERQRAHAI